MINYGEEGSPVLLAARPRLAPAVNWARFLGNSAGRVCALWAGLAPALLPLLSFSVGASCTQNINVDKQANGMTTDSASNGRTRELFMPTAVANLMSMNEAASALSTKVEPCG